jgi:hypothetical protein
MGVDPAVFGKVLAGRLADIAAAAERYDGFAYSDRPPPTVATRAAEDPAVEARDLALSALRAAADPLAYAMLRRMAEADVPLSDLSAVTGLPRLAVWERLNGLVAVGLAGRRHEDDSAGLTPAGEALVQLVEEAVAAAIGEPPA